MQVQSIARIKADEERLSIGFRMTDSHRQHSLRSHVFDELLVTKVCFFSFLHKHDESVCTQKQPETL